MARSEDLTKVMRKVFGNRVEEVSDIRKGLQHDIRQKRVYEREKKWAKARTTWIDPWSPIVVLLLDRSGNHIDERTSPMGMYRVTNTWTTV